VVPLGFSIDGFQTDLRIFSKTDGFKNLALKIDGFNGTHQTHAKIVIAPVFSLF